MSWLSKIPQGTRKLIVLAPAFWVAILAGVVALFTGDLPAEIFTDHCATVLLWGGGIFAGANVLEHLAERLGKRE